MLTSDEREEVKRLIRDTISGGHVSSTPELKPSPELEHNDQLRNFAALLRDLIVTEGFTEVSILNEKTGEKKVFNVFATPDSLVEITARAMEIFGSREKAIRWFKAPVRVLGNRTPMSLLNTPDGIERVQDALGQIEHGVW